MEWESFPKSFPVFTLLILSFCLQQLFHTSYDRLQKWPASSSFPLSTPLAHVTLKLLPLGRSSISFFFLNRSRDFLWLMNVSKHDVKEGLKNVRVFACSELCTITSQAFSRLLVGFLWSTVPVGVSLMEPSTAVSHLFEIVLCHIWSLLWDSKPKGSTRSIAR